MTARFGYRAMEGNAIFDTKTEQLFANEDKMESYGIVALETSIAAAVRTTLQSPRYGHPAYTEVATGYGPCRQCLRTFSVGSDRRILFTHDSFYGREEFPLPGPVFIHERECERYPENAGFPRDMLSHRLTLNAYAPGRRLVAQRHVANGGVEREVEDLLGNTEVAYIHVRDTDAGCYDFCIERASEEKRFQELTASREGLSNE
ncbi:MAG: DUF1203 domain-containing protein [Gemmatimonadaceae bacterium]